MTQEQAAEHLKRIRNDYCAGTVRDTLNRFVPQPAGPRRVIIRVAEPIAVHDYHGDAVAVTDELRRRLQAALDAINADLARSGEVRGYRIPSPAADAVYSVADQTTARPSAQSIHSPCFLCQSAMESRG